MKMLFLGGTFPLNMEKEILKKSKELLHYADNKFQWNIIDGFKNISEIDLEVISAPFIGAYPYGYRDFFIEEYNNVYNNYVKCKYVSFINLWGYRNISRKKSLKKQIHDFIQIKSSNKVIIVYSTHTPLVQAAVYAKQNDPSIHICLIVPDLPQFVNLNEKKSVVYSKLKEVDITIFKRNAKHIDSYVLLTEQMKDVLKVGNRPYLVIEGVVSTSETIHCANVSRSEGEHTVVYTGNLNKKFGVINLIEAFHKINNNNVVLKVCGTGDSENCIREYMEHDNRIHFLGQLSNDEVVKLQKSATILVNPRQNNEKFTKYSFPSKNMEYLLSGNPVIAYKLDGIPSEYDDYFFYVSDNSIDCLSNTIDKVLNLTDEERHNFGRQAKEFVLKTKNNNQASLKIYNMIKKSLE